MILASGWSLLHSRLERGDDEVVIGKEGKEGKERGITVQRAETSKMKGYRAECRVIITRRHI